MKLDRNVLLMDMTEIRHGIQIAMRLRCTAEVLAMQYNGFASSQTVIQFWGEPQYEQDWLVMLVYRDQTGQGRRRMLVLPPDEVEQNLLFHTCSLLRAIGSGSHVHGIDSIEKVRSISPEDFLLAVQQGKMVTWRT